MQTRPRASVTVVLAALATLVVGCASGASPTPTPQPSPSSPSNPPSPTPIAQPVTTPEEAASVVTGSDPRFAGIGRLDPNLIGASAWWTAEAAAGGGFVVTVVIGWGDCPAGCINRHQWRFDVRPDGTLTLLEETGEPLPAGTLPPG